MDEKLFVKLIESASQAVEIVHGDRVPSRVLEVTSESVAHLDPVVEDDALRWIEAVSDFDERPAR